MIYVPSWPSWSRSCCFSKSPNETRENEVGRYSSTIFKNMLCLDYTCWETRHGTQDISKSCCWHIEHAWNKNENKIIVNYITRTKRIKRIVVSDLLTLKTWCLRDTSTLDNTINSSTWRETELRFSGMAHACQLLEQRVSVLPRGQSCGGHRAIHRPQAVSDCSPRVEVSEESFTSSLTYTLQVRLPTASHQSVLLR